jgi:hypothetical protein
MQKKQRSSASQKQINCQVPKIVIQGRDMSENWSLMEFKKKKNTNGACCIKESCSLLLFFCLPLIASQGCTLVLHKLFVAFHFYLCICSLLHFVYSYVRKTCIIHWLFLCYCCCCCCCSSFFFWFNYLLLVGFWLWSLHSAWGFWVPPTTTMFTSKQVGGRDLPSMKNLSQLSS